MSTNKSLLLPLSLLLFSLVCLVKGQNGLTVDLGDKRYFIITTQKYNWFKANHACTSMGMALASIESETEYKNLQNYLIQKDHVSDGFWLSGNSLSGDTTFTWLSNGNALSFTKLPSGQTPAGNMCIKTNVAFNWEMAACDTGEGYAICSRPLIPDCGLTGGCKIDPSFFF